MTGDASSNTQPDCSNSGPYTSTAANKLVVHSSGARNPFGLGLDASGQLWFTNNFNRSQSDGTFDGRIDPATHALKGFTAGNPDAGPDIKNNVHDQFFKAAEKGDYGYNNINWRGDAAHHNSEVNSTAAMAAGFFDPDKLVRSTKFDNLEQPAGGFSAYDQSDLDHIVGLGPSSSVDGFAFYTADAFPAAYRGKAFISRWTPASADAAGHDTAMPLVRITHMKNRPPAFGKKIGEIVYRTMIDTINVPAKDNFQIITEHDADTLI